MSDLKIENGQFWKDGKVVPPVFGDRDQILTLRRAVGYQEEIEEGAKGIEVNFTTKQVSEVTTYNYSTEWEFKCLCGGKIGEYYSEKEEIDDWDAESEISEDAAENFDEDIECKCRTCGRDYIVQQTGEGVRAILQKD